MFTIYFKSKKQLKIFESVGERERERERERVEERGRCEREARTEILNHPPVKKRFSFWLLTSIKSALRRKKMGVNHSSFPEGFADSRIIFTRS